MSDGGTGKHPLYLERPSGRHGRSCQRSQSCRGHRDPLGFQPDSDCARLFRAVSRLDER